MEEYLEIHESHNNNNNEELRTFAFYLKRKKIGNINIKNNLFHRNFISKIEGILSKHEDHLKNNFFVEFLYKNNELDIIKNIEKIHNIHNIKKFNNLKTCEYCDFLVSENYFFFYNNLKKKK